MPEGLKRFQEMGSLHYLTFSCYRRLPFLVEEEPKNILEGIIERTRRSFRFAVYAYVLMPEHVHVLLSEPDNGSLASAMRVLKGESSKQLKGSRKSFWFPRYYDFNLFTERKFVEKIRYIHRNPVTRGLAAKPEDYRWSSFNHYLTGEPGTIQIESHWTQRVRASRE